MTLPLEGGGGVHTHLEACNGPQHHISNGPCRAEAEGQPRLACHLVQPKNVCQIAALQIKKERTCATLQTDTMKERICARLQPCKKQRKGKCAPLSNHNWISDHMCQLAALQTKKERKVYASQRPAMVCARLHTSHMFCYEAGLTMCFQDWYQHSYYVHLSVRRAMPQVLQRGLIGQAQQHHPKVVQG